MPEMLFHHSTNRMPITAPKHLAGLLKSGSESLGPLLAHVRRLEALNKMLREQLPPPLNQHCQAANLRDDTLLLHADSPAWALKLRYSAPVMLERLRRQPGLQQLRTINVKVKPTGIATTPAKKTRHAQMSEDTAKLLDDVAGAITDPTLRASLLRLARHGKLRG